MKTIKLFTFFILVIAVLTTVVLSGITAFSTTDDNTGPKAGGTVLMYVDSPKALVNAKEVWIDDSNHIIKPFVKNNTVLVPVKFTAESLGAGVLWNKKSTEATITLGKKVIRLKSGSSTMKAGNGGIPLGMPAYTVDGRLFAPLDPFVAALDKSAYLDKNFIIICDKGIKPETVLGKPGKDKIAAMAGSLPVVGTYEKLKELLSQVNESAAGIMYNGMKKLKNQEKRIAVEAVEAEAGSQSTTGSMADSISGKSSADGSTSGSYSTTNVQVQGVDEADIVKTDGKYIYQVNKQRIIVAEAYPAKDMKIASVLNFNDRNFTPAELYLHDRQLVVIGSTYDKVRSYMPGIRDGKTTRSKIYPRPDYSLYTVKTIVYDISDKSAIKKLREVELEGNYVSSRKIGSSIYIVTNRDMDVYYILKNVADSAITPSYRDSILGDGFIAVDYPEIRYFPGIIEPNYMIVAGINLEQPGEAVKISAYLGAGQNVYASQQNLYVAVTGRTVSDDVIRAQKVPSVTDSSKKKLAVTQNENTFIYKFFLRDGKASYMNKGEVPGTILNQFSMDEDGSYFRIATTYGNIRRNDEYTSMNNVYVLDEALNITGRLEDIAPGEKIYSVRFMGSRAYVVTFKTVDPLFVIDLKDPAGPKILGALKIPGYSDYLHPYDENHIIGFGKDTVELPRKDGEGNTVGTMAYYLGMKIAIFDVTNVNKPVEMFSTRIGDRGTDSELLRDHKALLFSRERELLAFPVTVTELKNGGKTEGNTGKSVSGDIPEYGEFSFQGAYVYSINLAKGFTLRAKITHLSDDDYLKAGSKWYDSDKNIDRILYIGDTLYTLSNAMIKAHGLDDMKERSTLSIP